MLSHGSFTPAFAVQAPRLASTEVAGRPRFAMSWTERAIADGPDMAFVAILE